VQNDLLPTLVSTTRTDSSNRIWRHGTASLSCILGLTRCAPRPIQDDGRYEVTNVLAIVSKATEVPMSLMRRALETQTQLPACDPLARPSLLWAQRGFESQ
jgi:hypothetical protein